MIKLEEGKYYRTADGRKVGPLTGNNTYKWVVGYDKLDDPEWENDGKGIDGTPDIVAEWTDEPKRWRDMTDAPSEHNLSDYVDPIKAITAE